jgi:hypothetical protein
MFEWLGWAATAVFTASYFCRRTSSLRQVQMLGAVIWIAYGVLVHARPVVAANLLVLLAAGGAAWRHRAAGSTRESVEGAGASL